MTHRRLVLDRRRWAATRRAVFARDGHRCRSCGRAGRLECDHVEPLWRTPDQDPYSIEGCQTLCRGCHVAKSAAERRREPTAGERAWRDLVAELR
ncbi:MAG: HNH endonuclease [Acidimicrobiaceae bacterium]|nr:HNH endonuclease [Acidimicrobiaceae bacterium]